MTQTLAIIAFLFSLLYSFAITPLVIHFATKFGLMDDPDSRRHPANTHKGIIPRAGGLGIFVAILLASLFFIVPSKILTGILLGGVMIVIVGLLDDKYDLSPYLRFFLNIATAAVVIAHGLGVPYISNPFGGVVQLDSWVVTFNLFGPHSFLVLSNLFSLVWIVAMMNFINWSKGVDGQLPGFVAISAFILGILAFRFSGHDIAAQDVVILSWIISGAFVGFIPWNFYPQSIMPGYSGGALAGYFLAVLSILSWGKVGTLLVVLSVPLIDAVYVLCRRIERGHSPFRGDDTHFHHRLLKIGWGRRRIAAFYWVVTALMGMSSLIFGTVEKVITLGVVVMLLFGFIAITEYIYIRQKA